MNVLRVLIGASICIGITACDGVPDKLPEWAITLDPINQKWFHQLIDSHQKEVLKLYDHVKSSELRVGALQSQIEKLQKGEEVKGVGRENWVFWSDPFNEERCEKRLNELGLHPAHVFGNFNFNGDNHVLRIWHRANQPDSGWTWDCVVKPYTGMPEEIAKSLGSMHLIPLGVSKDNANYYYLEATNG